LHGHAPADIGGAAADRGDHLAATAKTLIQRAFGGVAHQRKVIGIAAIVGMPRDDDLAVALHDDALAEVVATADCGHYLAVATKARVQRALGGVADQRKVVVGAIAGISPHDDFPIALHGHGL